MPDASSSSAEQHSKKQGSWKMSQQWSHGCDNNLETCIWQEVYWYILSPKFHQNYGRTFVSLSRRACRLRAQDCCSPVSNVFFVCTHVSIKFGRWCPTMQCCCPASCWLRQPWHGLPTVGPLTAYCTQHWWHIAIHYAWKWNMLMVLKKLWLIYSVYD